MTPEKAKELNKQYEDNRVAHIQTIVVNPKFIEILDHRIEEAAKIGHTNAELTVKDLYEVYGNYPFVTGRDCGDFFECIGRKYADKGFKFEHSTEFLSVNWRE
jgi:hypothetical protein